MTALPDPDSSDVLYVVDLSSIARRCFEAIPPSSSPVGEPTAAVAGFLGTLVRILRERAPAYLGVCADTSGPTWRHALFAGYKAARRAAPPSYLQQLGRIRQLLALHRIPVFEAEGFEADDLLAAVVERGARCGLRCVIVTGDKDLQQLVSDQVLCWGGGKADGAVGPAEVEARFGVPPALLGDWLALVGDATDGIRGVEGIGPKTATELLRKRGSLSEALRKPDHEPPRLRDRLRLGAASARLARELVGLRSDAPLRFDLQELRHGGYDVPALRALYRELGFTRLALVEPFPKPPLPASTLALWSALER